MRRGAECARFRHLLARGAVHGPPRRGFAVGRVDLVYREGDALVVVDYKSDEVAAAQVEGHARTHHAGQAEVYAHAVARASGAPVKRVVFVFPRAGSEVALSPLPEVGTVRDNG